MGNIELEKWGKVWWVVVFTQPWHAKRLKGMFPAHRSKFKKE